MSLPTDSIAPELLVAIARAGGVVRREPGGAVKLRGRIPEPLVELARAHRDDLAELLADRDHASVVAEVATAIVRETFGQPRADMPSRAFALRLRERRRELLEAAEEAGWPPVSFPDGTGLPAGREDVWRAFATTAQLDAIATSTEAVRGAQPFPPPEVPPLCDACGTASWWTWDRGRSWLCGQCQPPNNTPSRVEWWGERPRQRPRGVARVVPVSPNLAGATVRMVPQHSSEES